MPDIIDRPIHQPHAIRDRLEYVFVTIPVVVAATFLIVLSTAIMTAWILLRRVFDRWL